MCSSATRIAAQRRPSVRQGEINQLIGLRASLIRKIN
jgi:hypothetical protein